MIIKKIKIDVYDWTVYFLEVESSKDAKKILPYLKKLMIPPEEIDRSISIIKDDRYNGGDHFCLKDRKWSVVILYRSSSSKARRRILAHEKRHVEDVLLEYSGIKDKESAGFLSGFLAMKLY